MLSLLQEGIMELTCALTDRDLYELMVLLGWYAYLRWNNPTGAKYASKNSSDRGFSLL